MSGKVTAPRIEFTAMTFAEVKTLFKAAVKAIVRDHQTYAVDEAALPAYAHVNPVIDYIFWQRVKLAYDYLHARQAKTVLDFGCGTGLLSYALAQSGMQVTAIDLDFAPLTLVKARVTFPDSIRFIEGDLLTTEIHDRFDAIVALDVLEHITPLEPYIARFTALLNPGGVIVVSGPTENILYKIGRRMAGQRFTGEYHVSNIHTIRAQFDQTLKTDGLATLIRPLPLFELFTASAP